MRNLKIDKKTEITGEVENRLQNWNYWGSWGKL